MSRKGLKSVQLLKNGVKWKVEDMKEVINLTLRGISAKEMVFGPRKGKFLTNWTKRQVSSKIADLRKQGFLPPKTIKAKGHVASSTTKVSTAITTDDEHDETTGEEEDDVLPKKKKKKKVQRSHEESRKLDDEDEYDDEDFEEEGYADFVPTTTNKELFSTPKSLIGHSCFPKPPEIETALCNKVKDPVKGSVIVRVFQFGRGVHSPDLQDKPATGAPYFHMDVDATMVEKDEDLTPFQKGTDYVSNISVMNKFAQKDEPEYAEGGVCGRKRYRVYFNEPGAYDFTIRDTGDHYLIKYGYESEFMETPTKKLCANLVGTKVK